MKQSVFARIIGVTACSFALAVGVSAADKQAPSAKSDAPVAGVTTLGVAVAEEAAIAKGWRASKLLHADVYNDQNQKIGKIDDFIVTPDGTLSVAVVDVGGFLGLGAHRVAIPVSQLGGVGPKVVLKGATKEALKGLPEFKYT